MTQRTAQRDCAAALRVLADPTRLHVVSVLFGGPRTVSEINRSLACDQSLLSHHLRVLRDAGLVRAERLGKSVLYELSRDVALSGGTRELDLGAVD